MFLRFLVALSFVAAVEGRKGWFVVEVVAEGTTFNAGLSSAALSFPFPLSTARPLPFPSPLPSSTSRGACGTNSG
jgi:hypothetical protein